MTESAITWKLERFLHMDPDVFLNGEELKRNPKVLTRFAEIV